MDNNSIDVHRYYVPPPQQTQPYYDHQSIQQYPQPSTSSSSSHTLPPRALTSNEQDMLVHLDKLKFFLATGTFSPTCNSF